MQGQKGKKRLESAGGTILNGLRYALAIFSGRIILIYNFETPAGVSKLLFSQEGS